MSLCLIHIYSLWFRPSLNNINMYFLFFRPSVVLQSSTCSSFAEQAKYGEAAGRAWSRHWEEGQGEDAALTGVNTYLCYVLLSLDPLWFYFYTFFSFVKPLCCVLIVRSMRAVHWILPLRSQRDSPVCSLCWTWAPMWMQAIKMVNLNLNIYILYIYWY